MIRELVENYEENKNIVDNLNIHILPMANPDGYEYSRSDVSLFNFRMWMVFFKENKKRIWIQKNITNVFAWNLF